jgi:hypothetical protein
MILDTSGIGIARRIVGHIGAKRRPRARRRTNFFFQHATATIAAAWEIYHGASDSIELESLNEREGDATRENSVYLAAQPAAVTHTSAPSDTSGTRRIIHFGISLLATDVARTRNRLYRLDRLCNHTEAIEAACDQTGGGVAFGDPGVADRLIEKTGEIHANYLSKALPAS